MSFSCEVDRKKCHSFLKTTLILGLLSVTAEGHASLVASYGFSGSAQDTSGNNHHGVVSGATLVADRFGNSDSAYLFDGVDDSIEIPDTGGAFDLVGPFSLSAWANPATASVDQRSSPIIWKVARNGLTEDNYFLGYGNNVTGSQNFTTGRERASDGQDFSVTSNPHKPNNWYHLAAVYDGSELLIYVDGVLEGTSTVGASTPFTGSAPLRIGNILNTNHANAGVFNGVIDDIAIYDSPLSSSEINSLAAVPLPASLLFFVSGVLSIFAIRKKSGKVAA